MKAILRNGGFLVRVYDHGEWIGGIIIKPVSYAHELYVLGVKDGDYNAVTALYWFGLKALAQCGIYRVSLSTVAPLPE